MQEAKPSSSNPEDDDQILSDNPTQINDLLSGVSQLNPELNPQPDATSSSADLLGLTMDNEFSDFLSYPAPFMPSTLLTNPEPLEISALDQLSSLNQQQPSTPASSKPDLFGSFLQSISKNTNPMAGTGSSQPDAKKPHKDGKTGKDLSGWYQLFAELDPLSNPDAIPSKSDAPTNSLAA